MPLGSKQVFLKVELKGYLTALDLSQSTCLEVCRGARGQDVPRPCEEFERLARSHPHLFHNFRQIVKTRMRNSELQSLLLDLKGPDQQGKVPAAEEVTSAVYVNEDFEGSPRPIGKEAEAKPRGENEPPIVPDSSRQNNSGFGRIAGGISAKTKGKRVRGKEEEFDFSVRMFESRRGMTARGKCMGHRGTAGRRASGKRGKTAEEWTMEGGNKGNSG